MKTETKQFRVPKKFSIKMQLSKGFGSIVPSRQVAWLPSGYPLGMLKENNIHLDRFR